MAASSTNTDIIIDVNSADVPCCPHGPALLFERFTKSKGCRKFYACSAFRDHKLCGFFRWADDVRGRNKGGNPQSTGPTEGGLGCPLSHSAYRKRFLQFKKQPLSKRSLCSSCGLLLLDDEVKEHEDKGHQIKRRITRVALQHPTTLFEPQEDNKTYAQYLFADTIVKFLLKCLEEVKKTHILCVGTPRLHEAVTVMRKAGETKMTSLLMDLDSRYAQVYSKRMLCRYNMFNHHFFDPQGEDQFKSFVREAGSGLVLVTDPPFGGMVEALVATFRRIEDTWKAETRTDTYLPIVWFFPYFMEKRMCECMPSLTMLDYKVDYDNHNLFQNTGPGGRKKGSPVRIFTNLPSLSFPLPSSEGYWFCEVCQRFSASENRHCLKCDSCTSKDGTTYRHCDDCQRCVKATRVHCQTCGVCDLPEHKCGQRFGEGCHICGALDHKRRDCPQRHKPSPRNFQGKRSAKQLPVSSLKKKKRTK